MLIKTKLSEKDFISASFTILLSRKATRILLIVIMTIMLLNVVSAILTNEAIIATVLPLVIIYGAMFLVLRFSYKNAYRKNYRSSETIEYQFTDTHIKTTGESFNAEMTWDKIYKVTKTTNWLLIWQSNQIANAIPVKQLSTENLTDLKAMLKQNNTKNNL